MSFERIAGQPRAVAFLRKALDEDKLSHALVFQGAAGSGQMEAALEVTKHLFCEDRKGDAACDACVSCRQVEAGSHPDLLVLKLLEENREIKVDAVREINTRASFKPLRARAKVFIVDEAHTMNDTAQNAFLKTLEEPSGRTYFILITSAPQALLPTIRSRVQVVPFAPVPFSKQEDTEAAEAKKEILDYLLYTAGDRRPEPDLSGLERAQVARALDGTMDYLREILVWRAGAGEILGPEALYEKERLEKKFTEDEILRAIETLSQAKERVLQNVNVKMIFSLLWDDLKGAHAR